MDKKTSLFSGNITFLELLTLIFITLKLVGKISWSWWWVLSPLWIAGLVGIVIMLIAKILSDLLDKRT